jgi:TPR repeat protein
MLLNRQKYYKLVSGLVALKKQEFDTAQQAIINVVGRKLWLQCYIYLKQQEVTIKSFIAWCIERCSKTNDGELQSFIAYCFGHGYGVNLDLTAAILWHEKASSNGSVESSHVLGSYYYNSKENVNENQDRGLFFYQKAAMKGHVDSFIDLASIYMQRKDMRYVFTCYLYLAKYANYNIAKKIVGELYFTGQGVSKDYKEAFFWYQRAARTGDLEACLNVASMHETGVGTPIDYKRALELYKDITNSKQKNIDSILSKAEYNIGCIYLNGNGVKANSKEAIKWFTKASTKNNCDAVFNLACIHDRGHGVPKNIKEALKWYKKAAELGSFDAQYNVGCLYIKLDYPKELVLDCFFKAATAGHKHAQYNLGLIYLNGCSVETDISKAKEWFTKALNKGVTEAKIFLDKMDEELESVKPAKP